MRVPAGITAEESAMGRTPDAQTRLIDHTYRASPPHRPGTGTQPPHGAFAVCLNALPAEVTSADWASLTAYATGFQLCRDGYFREAHEVWEAVWKRCAPHSRERAVLQGLIQAANASLKASMSNEKAAARLWPIAAEHFAEAAGHRTTVGSELLMGLDPVALSRDAADLESHEEFWSRHYISC